MTEQKTQEKLNEEIIHKIQIEEKFYLLNDPEIQRQILNNPEILNICFDDFYIIKTIVNSKWINIDFFQELITKKATITKEIISRERINAFKTKANNLKDYAMINFLNQAEIYNNILAYITGPRKNNFMQIIFNDNIPNDQKYDIINILDNNKLHYTSKKDLMTIIDMNKINTKQKINLINTIKSNKIPVEQKTDLIRIINGNLITVEQKHNLINIIKSDEITDEQKTGLLNIIKRDGLNMKQKGGLINQVNNNRLELEHKYSLMSQEEQDKLTELRQKQGSLENAITHTKNTMIQQKTQKTLNEEIIHKIQIEKKFYLLNKPEIQKQILNNPEMLNICLNDYYIMRTIANNIDFYKKIMDKKTEMKKEIISQEMIDTFRNKATELEDKYMINFICDVEFFSIRLAKKINDDEQTNSLMAESKNINNEQKNKIRAIIDDEKIPFRYREHFIKILNDDKITNDQRNDIINICDSDKFDYKSKEHLIKILYLDNITFEQKINLINIIKSNEIVVDQNTGLLSIIKHDELNMEQKGEAITQVINNNGLKLEQVYSLRSPKERPELTKLRQQQVSLGKAITEIEPEHSKTTYK